MWLDWTGGHVPPVSADTQVRLMLRGTVGAGLIPNGPVRAGDVDWRHSGDMGDVVRYQQVTARPAPPTPGAADLLSTAAGHMRARAATYDKPGGERSMGAAVGAAVGALNAVLGRQALSESEGWLLLQLLKDVRDRQRPAPHQDSLEDCVAYAALKAEARLAGR
jgi:hypothetical protein